MNGSLLFVIFTALSCRNNGNIITAFGNLGAGINTQYDEFAPSMNDSLTLVFSSNRPTKKQYGLRNEIEKKNVPSLFYSIFSDGAWEFSMHYTIPIDSLYSLQQISFSDCRTQKQLTRNHRFYAVATATKFPNTNNTCKIIMLDESLKAIELEIGENKWQAQATFANCQQIYFASEKNNGKGKSDIWRVAVTNTGFSEPENVGVINTTEDEVSPFFDASTQRLYFARKEKSQIGSNEFDIYYHDFNTAKTVKLPQPYNSDFSDYTPFIYGEKIYLSSNRTGSCGGYDLYAFQKPK